MILKFLSNTKADTGLIHGLLVFGVLDWCNQYERGGGELRVALRRRDTL
jgi:hypothetical protein